MVTVSRAPNPIPLLYVPNSRPSAPPACRRIAKLTSAGVVPMPLLPRPTNRSVLLSSVENCSMPLPLTCWLDAAVPSGKRLHPPVLVSVATLCATFMRLIQVALPAAGAVGAGVVGAGVVGPGVVGAGVVGAGVVGAGVTGDGVVGVGAPGDTPSLSCGIRTMNASCRPVPMFAVQMKYSPVTSMLPDGIFQ